MTKITYIIAVAGLVAVAPGCSTSRAGGSSLGSGGKQIAKHFTFKKTQQEDVDYLLFLPRDYARNPEKRWPMILFLHGAGERGSNVSAVAANGPPKHVADHLDFPFILVSPQCPDSHLWSRDVLLNLLDEVTRRYAVDTNRVYLTGLSMGGYGTWDLGMAYPEKFAAIVPVCGGGASISVILSTGEKDKALKTLGVWAFHGGKDPVVPLEEDEHMVSMLKRHGVQDVKLTVYPEAGHDAWTETYANPELYQWLLQHDRSVSGRN